jgi:hypothetical protein
MPKLAVVLLAVLLFGGSANGKLQGGVMVRTLAPSTLTVPEFYCFRGLGLVVYDTSLPHITPTRCVSLPFAAFPLPTA